MAARWGEISWQEPGFLIFSPPKQPMIGGLPTFLGILIPERVAPHFGGVTTHFKIAAVRVSADSAPSCGSNISVETSIR